LVYYASFGVRPGDDATIRMAANQLVEDDKQWLL
jgi:hypothetical protein